MKKARVISLKSWSKESEMEQFLFSLDIQPVALGCGYNVTDWQCYGLSPTPFFRVYLIVSGSFNLQFPTESYTLEAGNMYFIPQNKSFRFESVAPCTHYYFHFKSQALENVLFSQQPQKVSAGTAEIALFKELAFRRSPREKKLLADILKEKMDIHRLLLPFLEKIPAGKDELLAVDGRFMQVLNYINEHLAEDIAIVELENIANMNRLKFSSEFRKIFGFPPKQYISICRIQRAKNLLVQTDLPCVEIARRTGYRSLFFFYKIFKKYVHLTPNEFRNMDHLD